MPIRIETTFTNLWPQPLSHPRVGWRRLAGDLVFSTEAEGFAAANARTPRTDSFWRPTAAPAHWGIVQPSGTVVASYVGVAAHDLAGKVVTVETRETAASAWVPIPGLSFTPDSAEPILFLFTPRNHNGFRLAVSGGVPTVGVIFIGRATEFPRRATFAPSVSLQRARQTVYSINQSDRGQWLGRTKLRQQMNPQMVVDNLPEAWIAAEFDALAAHAENDPFFVADRPGQYPDSVAYAWTTGDLIPQRGLAKASVANSVTMELVGFRGV